MVEDIVLIWRNLKDGFGLFFLFHFAVTQVLCVVLVFLVVFDGLNGEFATTLDQNSTLLLFVSIGKKITKIEILTLPYIFSVLNLLSISQVAEYGYNALQNVADNIQIKIRLPSTTDSEREILKSHYFEIKSVPMLSANGYFDIGNQTLVSMLSVRKAIIFRLK